MNAQPLTHFFLHIRIRLRLLLIIMSFLLSAHISPLRGVPFHFGNLMLMLDATLAHKGKTATLPVGISLGSSHCFIDSSYAAQHFSLDSLAYKPMTLNGGLSRAKAFSLDSLVFCGDVYRNVTCVIYDLKSVFKDYVPNMLIGADVLKDKAWRVDRVAGTFERCDPNVRYSDVALKWKSGKGWQKYAVYFDVKMLGRKLRMQFFASKGRCALPHGIYNLPYSAYEKKSASIKESVHTETVPLYKSVPMSIGDYHFVVDCTLEHPGSKVGVLKLEFLGGRSFVLNYKKKRLEFLDLPLVDDE